MLTWQLTTALILMIALVASVEAGTKRAKPPDDSPSMTPEAKAARVVKEFPSYEKPSPEKYRRQWRNVVISPGNSIEALTALAKRLHAEDPESCFSIFTDGNEKQFRRFMLWDIHFATDDSARYPIPRAWADRHAIAMICRFRPAGGWRWQLLMNHGDGVTPPVEFGYSVDLE